MSLFLAATATVLAATAYGLSCWLFPFAACRRCDSGKQRSPSGRAWRTCRRCKGSGARLRIGRQAWNAWNGVHRGGTR